MTVSTGYKVMDYFCYDIVLAQEMAEIIRTKVHGSFD